jgi:Ca2+-binding EF-hand superfamily protein
MVLKSPLQTQEDKLKFSFMVFDEDGNGVITKAELTRILKANHMASSEAEVARKADTIMNQADKGVYAIRVPNIACSIHCTRYCCCC